MAKDDLQRFNLSEVAGIIPASYRITGPDAMTPGSIDVIAAHAQEINRFLFAQRQDYALSPNMQARAIYASDDLDITYHNVNGEERVELSPRVAKPVDEPQPVPPKGQEPTDVYVAPNIDIEQYLYLPCMLVLYKGNHFAAIPMGQLDAPPSFAPIFSFADKASMFQQPVKTAQITCAGTGFIHTDVDLSGRGLAKSIVCTTTLLDAISLTRQVLPVINSPSLPKDAPTPGGRITIYTGVGAVNYVDAKFSLGTHTVVQDIPSAIGPDGMYYYTPTVTDNDLVQLSFADTTSTIDIDTPINKAEQSIYSWVKVYAANWVRAVREKRTYHRQDNPHFFLFYFEGFIKEYLTLNDSFVSQIETDVETISIASTVVPQPPVPNQPPDKLNLLLTTEINGENYYVSGLLGEVPMLSDVELAYDNTPYNTYDYGANQYQYDRVTSSQPDYSGPIPRQVVGDDNALTIVMDQVAATVSNAFTYTLKAFQQLPLWGGSFFSGGTTDVDTTDIHDLTAPDGEVERDLLFSKDFQQRQIIANSTVANTAGKATGTYGDVEAAVDSMVAALAKPTCSPNGEPGPSGTFSSTNTFGFTIENHSVPPPNQNYNSPVDLPTIYTPINQSGGGSGRSPPAITIQQVFQYYSNTITWLDYSVMATQSDDPAAPTVRSGQIEVLPFPFGTKGKAFAAITQQQGSETTYRLVSPYGEFPGASENSTLVGWMHVSNPDHLLQGVVYNGKPYIWLDGTDITVDLAKALNCQPTDIAACYFDISLDTINLLAKVM